MIWDVLNALIQTAIGVLHYWMNLLPASPLFLSGADVAAVAGVTGYAAWFLPILAMSITFALFFVGVMTWVVVLLVKQLIEAVIP
jgi:hypothetical protein